MGTTKSGAASKAKPSRKSAPANGRPAKTRSPGATAAPPAARPSSDAGVLGFDLDADAFVTDDPKRAYDHFAKVVLARGGEIPVANGSAAVVRHNVQRGFNAIASHLSEIPQLVPGVSINRLMELPTLALALAHAEGRIPATTKNDVEAALARVTEPRELTLSFLEIAAKLALVDAQRVRDIRAGSGKLDKARDCVDIAGMFDEHASALKGRHPFPPGYVDDMRATGAFLVETLTPGGAVRDRTKRSAESDVRDRLFQAVRTGYDDLEKVAVQLWGLRGAIEKVPAMLAHEQSKTVPPPPPRRT